MKKTSWLLWLCSLFLLTALIGCSTSAANTTNSVTPKPTVASTSTATAVSNATQPPAIAGTRSVARTPEDLANQFYHAIEAQNYPLAYAYLDVKATNVDGAVLTLDSFRQMAQDQNAQFGSITDFSAAWYAPMLVMTIMRKQLGMYHAHLQLRKEGLSWKIVSLDRV